MGSLSLLHGVFPTQRSNLGFPHCRRILYQLSHKGSPRILEWVPYPFSRRSSQHRNRTRVSCIAGGFFTNWAIREALEHQQGFQNWVTLDIFYVSWKWNILELKQYDMLNVKIMNYDHIYFASLDRIIFLCIMRCPPFSSMTYFLCSIATLVLSFVYLFIQSLIQQTLLSSSPIVLDVLRTKRWKKQCTCFVPMRLSLCSAAIKVGALPLNVCGAFNFFFCFYWLFRLSKYGVIHSVWWIQENKCSRS